MKAGHCPKIPFHNQRLKSWRVHKLRDTEEPGTGETEIGDKLMYCLPKKAE